MDTRQRLAAAAARAGAVRVNGLVVLVGIVFVGLVTGAGFYRMKRGELDAKLAAEVAAAPASPAERLELWLRIAGPQIHHRLAVVGRFSPEMPWLVTHALSTDAGATEIWGVECAELPQDLARLEGMRVVVALPAPRRLGQLALEGEGRARVPIFAPEARPDGRTRLSELALHLLEGIPRALARDVPGASLEIEVAEESGF